MIEIRRIDAQHKSDINIPNEPFYLTEMTFPDENYDYENMRDSVFLGAYDGEKCVGLAILQPGFFKYMYLYDLKVNQEYRCQHVGRALIAKAKDIAAQSGYAGLYTQGQDNNPGACLFYLNSGFYIGGLDTNTGTQNKKERRTLFFIVT